MCDHPYMARIQTRMPGTETSAYCNICRTQLMLVDGVWEPYEFQVHTKDIFTGGQSVIRDSARERGGFIRGQQMKKGK